MEPQMAEAMDRPTEAINRLAKCSGRDACEYKECAYYDHPSDLTDVICYIEYLEKKIESLNQTIEDICCG